MTGGGYPDGPGWVNPGYPGTLPETAHETAPEPPTDPHWVIREGPEPGPLHVDRRRGLRLAAVLTLAVLVIGGLATWAFGIPA